ncbi:hypothetical protein CEXT_637041 [Caerostris extrusa]|uniref:Uncharacterized protein n=1 Tax=Caerostris extrusa TaxID=172846 RepID=A0AAV4TAT8_CAEEX|nr:hypothetical protein CEXT_637041 [Caerostris extrusa]
MSLVLSDDYESPHTILISQEMEPKTTRFFSHLQSRVRFASTNCNHEIIASGSEGQDDTCFDTVACGDPFWDGAGVSLR